MEMNSRRPDKRQFQPNFCRRNNYSDAGQYSNKRKSDDHESEPPSKKLYNRYPYEETAPRYESYAPQNPWKDQDRSSNEPEEQPRRYRANDRLKKIRHSQGVELAANVNNIQVRFSTESNKKQPFAVTSIPSQLQRPGNDSAMTNLAKSSTITRRDAYDNDSANTNLAKPFMVTRRDEYDNDSANKNLAKSSTVTRRDAYDNDSANTNLPKPFMVTRRDEYDNDSANKNLAKSSTVTRRDAYDNDSANTNLPKPFMVTRRDEYDNDSANKNLAKSSTVTRRDAYDNDSANTNLPKPFTVTRRDAYDTNALQNNRNERPFIATDKPKSLTERLVNQRMDVKANSLYYSSREVENIRKPPARQNEDRERVFTVTARPKSLEERLRLIRSTSNQNTGSSKSSVASVNRESENRSNLPVLQNKFADYDERGQSRQRKASTGSLQNSAKSDTSGGEDVNVTPAAMYSNPEMTNFPTPSMASSISKTADDTFMDWSFTEEREVLYNLQELRDDGAINHEPEPQTPFQEVVAKGSEEIPQNQTILKDIYVVVDTNIFLSHLNIVKDLLEIKVNGVVSPIVLIPWMVIQELDYIKDGRAENALKSKAQKAINFISDHLLRKNCPLKGQSIRDAARQDFSSKSADDGILYCCMQVLERRNRPMLLTNDVNLRNKATINNIDSYKHNEIIHALDPFRIATSSNSDHNKMKQMEAPLSRLLSEIIMFYLEEGFGAAAWSKMRCSLKKPPWCLEDCLQLLRKYWRSIFSQNVLQNHSLSKIVNLHEFLQKRSNGHTTRADLDTFIDLTLAVCLFLKNDLSKYENRFTQCINHIQSIGNTLIKSLDL